MEKFVYSSVLAYRWAQSPWRDMTECQQQPCVITIDYFELVKTTSGSSLRLLGRETYKDITHTLLPDTSGHAIYVTRRFASTTQTKWLVIAVRNRSEERGLPASYAVTLEPAKAVVQEVTFAELVKRNVTKVHKALRQGTLVEIDYGFIELIGGVDGSRAVNDCYNDSVMHGEMHKRRLAVVVNVDNGSVQVAPVTSQPSSAHDKTSFRLDSQKTLNSLVRYGKNGSEAWVLCRRLQTVSLHRLMPPLTVYGKQGRTYYDRHNNFISALSSDDLERLKAALPHAVGISDYAQKRNEAKLLLSVAQERDALVQDNAKLVSHLGGLESKIKELEAIAKVARQWDEDMGGGQLARQVQEIAEPCDSRTEKT